ncbi:conserved hypothetical protein [Uncinocarpus reesii 1704]|uniref:Lactamase-like protein nscB n=1 Tax=Uncinocarpus reesii (strain UAMH 1704) TaxID=336963 RepID=C4JSK1_UNCRE|nr:uncharacterized protein UREG_05440 [Uncinocarpus reesii 1704]EEP80598.1 conserved hypothetical protein [Uncinocarpus reesii 1704]
MATQLVSLPEVERLSASVIRILAGNPGKFTLQVEKKDHLRSHGRRKNANHHSNQAQIPILSVAGRGGSLSTQAKDLSNLCPEAKIYKHDLDEGEEDIEDGQVFSVEGTTLTAFHTPGHTTDHMAFVFEEENAMFTGDNVLGHGTAVFENLGVYLSTLEKMSARGAKRGYPGHGPIIEDCRTKIMEYINHRRQRENEVLRVLENGTLDTSSIQDSDSKPSSWTTMELVKIIYKNVPENLHLPASHGVNQVLLKLEGDGKTDECYDSLAHCGTVIHLLHLPTGCGGKSPSSNLAVLPPDSRISMLATAHYSSYCMKRPAWAPGMPSLSLISLSTGFHDPAASRPFFLRFNAPELCDAGILASRFRQSLC